MLAGSAPTWLSRAQHLGATIAAAPQTVRVYLAPNGGQANLQAAVTAISTPGSATYRDFLTPSAYYARFSPTIASVAAVSLFLRAAGFTVSDIDSHRRFLDATGSASAAEKAFAVSLQKYTHDGQSVQAPSGAASVPATVAADVLAVSGLDTTKQVATTQDPPPAAFVNARPCSTYYAQIAAKDKANFTTPLPKFQGATLPYAVCGYTGPQLRSAYEANSTLTGAGVSVGIIDAYAAPTIAQDANEYGAINGDGAYAPGQLTQTVLQPFTDQATCVPNGWYGEETLDVEAVHAMAPAAKIHYYGGASCDNPDLLNAARVAVDDDKVQLITNSYGDPSEAESVDSVIGEEQVFLQGAIEGISFLFSSGDDGDEGANTGIVQADYPASDPLVTAVGATSTSIDGNGALEAQAGWGTVKYALSASGTQWVSQGFLYGSGGGYSTLFNRPGYQVGVVPADAPGGRAVPDVAMNGDPNTGMLVGESQTYPDGSVHYGQYRVGGTSLASPLFAGMTALLEQHAGGPLGLLNIAIYKQAKSGAGTFTDVKGAPIDAGNVRPDYVNGVDPSGGISYSVRTFGQDSSLSVTPGWDDVTGIGSANAKWLTSIAH